MARQYNVGKLIDYIKKRYNRKDTICLTCELNDLETESICYCDYDDERD